MRHILLSAGVFAFLVAVPHADGHVLAIAGAAGFDDQPFINLVQQLAATERAMYENERPAGCNIFFESPTTAENVMKGTGYTILLRPTGDFAMDPEWPSARARLENEISAFQTYLQNVDTPCVCREYLHIVGFSDGASTIGGWLNNGALNTQPGDDFYGVVAIIDAVRQFNQPAPNINTNATWQVSAMPPDRTALEYAAFRNRSGGLLNGCNVFTGDWTGHRITTTPIPWSDSGLSDDDTCHTDFPVSGYVAPSLLTSIDGATSTLLFIDDVQRKCNCVIVDSCPDLDGDGDIDLNDYQIFEQNFTGPTSGRGALLGDIDGDGDIDLRDFAQFQRAFPGS